MIKKYTRSFLPKGFVISDWASVQVFYDDLLARPIVCLDDLVKLLKDWSELEGVLEEDMGWRYIKTSCNTMDMVAKERYQDFVTNIEPCLQAVTDALMKKVCHSPEAKALCKDESFALFFKRMQDNLRCFREENIPIHTEVALNANKYGSIVGAMVVEVEGKELTLQQAGVFLESQDRILRKDIYDKIQMRRLQDKDVLDDLYSTLIHQRHQIALNAGFENFRDYAFVSMHRFDYTPLDCFNFHTAIKEEIVPLLNVLAKDRQKQLGITKLRPFDWAVDVDGKEPLRPFLDSGDMIEKTIVVFEQLHPYLADCLRVMLKMGHLDLDSRKGKAPGGYNYPLAETGVPFIFMNATATLKDMITMLHEGGHAVHAFLVHDLMLNAFKHCPSEIAELASMSMELLTMPYWDVFFPNSQDLRRARKNHLIRIITILSWIATIDAFQHWIYEHPYHSKVERFENWNRVFDDFSDDITDWTGYETIKGYLWQKQLHLFEVPFYYIEYAIAQLGAIGIWKNAQENPKQALNAYMSGLKLGSTTSIHNVYQACGVQFNFSRDYIRSLVQFVYDKFENL